MMNKIRYMELLDMEYAITDSLRKAKRDTAEVVKRFGTDTVLYRMATDDEDALQTATDVCHKVIEMLRAHELYTHND